ncbi:MAG: NAD-binding protein [Erysipelotrichaceae bacterium]|nr:NAD-binding protein [Erysipelotrichaceae bacterium]
MSSNVNTIVVGAGRIGSNIAKKLQKENRNVLLIDKNKEKIAKLDDFSGFVETGDATDLSFLEENGIKDVDRALFVTDDDNTNIFLSDICIKRYGLKEIYIRLTDSRKIKIVNENVRCICPFDLSLNEFSDLMKGEKK